MNKIETTIFVVPTPKGRPRSAIVAGHVQVYTPKKTREAEADIKAAIRQEVMEKGHFGEGVPLRVEVTFLIEKPKSLPKRVLFPVKKPDGTNYEALLLDALQKFVFPNDSQICSMEWNKRYCEPGLPPCITLSIQELAELEE